MAYAKVDVNTNPIPATILDAVPLTFPSGGGGGGGGGGGNIFPSNYNANGASLAAPAVVPAGVEQDLASFNINFVGGKQALFLGFASFAGAVISAGLRLYVNGALVSQTVVAVGQSISWGLLVPTVAGPTILKITALNSGAAPLPVPSAETLVVEFL